MSRRQANAGEYRNCEPKSPFDVHLRKHGTCAICRERDTQRHHGAAHCAGNYRRQHPTCTHDQRKPRFALDLQALRSIGATP